MTSMQVVGCTPPTAYMPNTIVQVPRPVTDYARFMTDAPSVALAPARKDCTEEQPLQSSRRHRTRLQVGNTNRWRLPQSLLSDLLGMSQATRAVQYNSVKPFNSSYIKIFSGEGRHSYMNEDMNKEISLVTCKKNLPEEGAPAFSQSSLRPSWQGSRANSSRSDIRSVQSAPVKLSVSRSAPSYSRMTEYVPERTRPSSTKDLFYYHTRLSPQTNAATPDVLLRCMDMDFELHSLVLKRSPVLSSLLEETMGSTPVDMSYYKSSVNKTLDGLISSSELNYRNSQSNDEHAYKRSDRPGKKAITHAAHVSEHMRKKVATIKWDLEDNSVSRHAMAIALGNLYHSSYQVHNTDLASVLLAADKLQYSQLVNYCVDEIISCISYSNVASFYDAGIKTEQVRVVDACIRWLELNLISVVMNKIQLRDIPIKLLETVLKSSKLFTYSEYHLYTCLSLWLFLRLNPHIQLMPASTNVITYFNSLPKHSSFLESDGQVYVPLFDCLRLHGITDTFQFENIRRMNILPQESMVSLLSEHYSALQSGGDMTLMRNFKLSSVRQGYVIEEDLPYHSEILSLHGFHFQLKTVKADGTFTFFMQRLKPTDPVLSFRHCERQTFSMRPDREVKYSITVQTYDNGVQYHYTTGVEKQKFTLKGKLVRSKVLSLTDLTPPLYVTFSLLFPQS